MYEVGKPQPNATEMEEAVLGSMLLESNCIDSVMDVISEECFYVPKHAEIFKAIKSLKQKKDAIDILTVTNELKRLGRLDFVDGAYYITQLTNRVASSHNVETHCRIILQQFIRRSIIQMSHQNIIKAQGDYHDSLDILDDWSKESKKLYEYVSHGKVTSIDEIYRQTIDDISSKTVTGRSSGLKCIDNLIYAFRPKMKYTIGARAGMGKSSLMMTLARNLVNQGSPGIIFSLEMSSTQLMTQIISAECEIDNQRIQKKLLTEDEWTKINNKMATFRRNLLVIDERTGISPDYIAKRIKKLKQSMGIEWFMVDYLGLMEMSYAERKGRTKEDIIGKMSADIRDIAKHEGVFAIELSQLSRPKEKQSPRPQLSDLKDSGNIEASADVVILLYRAEYYGFKTTGSRSSPIDANGLAEAIIAKNRHGKTDSAYMKFIPQFTKFVDGETIETPSIENEITDF